MHILPSAVSGLVGRSPSWGAWIEIVRIAAARYKGKGRSPSWGAWIEINRRKQRMIATRVAPPRGERGLKYPHPQAGDMRPGRRSPSWGAWIEIVRVACPSFCPPVAPPRGERGLKSKLADIALHIVASLPLVGSVD